MTAKLEKLMTMGDCDRCFASKAAGTVIDVIRPGTGRTWIYGKTLADTRAEYPDAEEMSLDEFCSWKAAQQRTPITWSATTAERYDEMLGVLPPIDWHHGARHGFLVGEPYDHDAGNGQPRYQAFRRRYGVHEVASRPMTRAEFAAEMGDQDPMAAVVAQAKALAKRLGMPATVYQTGPASFNFRFHPLPPDGAGVVVARFNELGDAI